MSRRGLQSSSIRGFTLVEVLVAVLVFSLMAATAYAGLNGLISATAEMRQRSTEFAGLQRVVMRLDLDLRQIVTRAGRDRQGRVLPVLSGDPQSLLARRAGRINPGGLTHSQLLQFRWRIDDGALVRETWAEVDDDPTTPPFARQRHDQVRSLEFRFLDSTGRRHQQWPVANATAQLPAAIEYVLDTPLHGRVRRLITL